MLKNNSHIHLPPNFSAFTTVAQAIYLAKAQDVRVIGVTNYYDYQVYGEFARLAREANIYPMFGLEIISLVDSLVKSGVKINDPGNPGRMYICGKGVTKFNPVIGDAGRILDQIKSADISRMKEMIDKAGAVFGKAGLDLGVSERSVKDMIVRRHDCPSEIVYLQERHIAQALQEALFAKVPAERRADLLTEVYGSAPKAPVDDAVKTQNELRSNLLRSGKPAFVVESFVSDAEARKMILAMGGIPCYPTLADGASPLCPYEATPETLVANIKGMGVTMAELIPARNTPEVLEKYVTAMRAAGLAVVGGTEHNSLDLIPLEPMCMKGASVPQRVKEIFWEGACVVAAHQSLVAAGKPGFVDEQGRANVAYSSDDERIKAFARMGEAVIAAYMNTTTWPTFSASDTPIEQLVKLSQYVGRDTEMVIAGGGNTSVKSGDRLWVKGSGSSLSDITPEGFVEMDRAKLDHLLEQKLSPNRMEREAQFKSYVMAARSAPEKGRRPSVEAVLHHLIPREFVVHTHSTIVNAFSCCVKGEALLKAKLGDELMYIGAVDPGFALASSLQVELKKYRKATGRDCPRAVVMQNHGLVICGDTPEQVKADTDWILAQLTPLLAEVADAPAFGAIEPKSSSQENLINVIGPALRGLLGTPDRLKIVSFDDCTPVMDLVCGADGKNAATSGPLSPDQIVYCRSFPLWFQPADGEPAEQLVQRLRQAIAEHTQATRFPPSIVLVKGVGLFAIGDDVNAANSIRLVYIDATKIMAGARRLGGVRYLAADFRAFIEDWEVESYRKTVSLAKSAGGRVAGKIAVITGAAQGFGLEISQHFAAEGGIIVLADMNAAGASKAAADLCAKYGPGRAIAHGVNVTDGKSISALLHEVVRTYGGFDVLISNAGVLKAGSVKTLNEKDFDFVTSVNYKGFFLCTQKASHILAVQRLALPDYWSDIIQINSKSGLRGSNKNAAYAGGKFGGIGLVESFAMELVEDGIKVNAICPGNFYDGPLWSDPKNGLFVQYLKAGKVPGARTVADVRTFYEAQAPIRRGCTTADVMKAVYYLMDQKYETGQALPVTGGQVMLK